MSSAQGRFISPDEVFADQFASNPQSWNLFSYTRNNPLNLVDREGNCAGPAIALQPYCMEFAERAAPYVDKAAVQVTAVVGVVVAAVVSGRAGGSASHQDMEDLAMMRGDRRGIYERSDKNSGKSDTNKRPGTKGKPDHQQTADEEADRIGGQREVKIDTTGGKKDSRRADAAHIDEATGKPDRIVQVIRPNKNGTPPKREVDAANDIERATGIKPELVPVRPLKPKP